MTAAIRWSRLPNIVMMGVLLVLLAFAFPAYHASAASICQTFPSGPNCTGKDPQAMGCDADAYNLASAEISGQVRAAVRYSPTCKSAWTRAVNLSTISSSRLLGQVVRSDNYAIAQQVIYPTTAVVTGMVYIGDGTSARAIGILQTSSGSIIGQVQTNLAHP